jgi:hypothetical protein
MPEAAIEKIVVLLQLKRNHRTMTSNLSLLLKKYTVPAVFTILGLIMVITGIQSSQNAIYIVATLMMFVAGVLSLLYSTGGISSKLLNILGFVALACSIFAMAMAYLSVRDTTNHIRNYDMMMEESQLNLSDIRAAQKAYAEEHGVYANTWEKLIKFIETGTVPFVSTEGVVPSRKINEIERNFLYNDNRAIDNNMTEEEAYRLSNWEMAPTDLIGFKRDTVQVSFMKSKFGSKSYKQARIKYGFGRFYADSLPYIPMAGGEKWTIETKDSVQIGEEFFPAISVSGMLPLARIQGTDSEEMYFGKLTTNDTGASWEQ